MSIKLIVATIALSLSATSAHAIMKYPYSPNDQSYRDAMEKFAQEMVTAKYGVKHCPDKISYNPKYFDETSPPNLWDANRFNGFMTVVMTNLKERLDEYQADVGTESFCKILIEFTQDNYPPNKSPILITNQ
jgi:hypothetical protein